MKKLAFILPVLIVFALAVAPMATFAAGHSAIPDSGLGSINSDNPGESGAITGTSELVSMILGLVNWFAWFVALAAVLFGLYSGVLFITAGGDEEKVTKAKNILLYAIVGIVVAILAFSIVSISKSIAGL